ncbi:hypothetical protein JD969_09035 [Planctomycetota bacterium]|nr:hypothetical protein JD969_09035 [Planctomycetota bacterium]
MSVEIVKLLVQFGVAGLMGVLWIWERFMSRSLIKQLSESHDYIFRQQEKFGVLIDIVKQNTETIEKFNQTQNRLKESLDNINIAFTINKNREG